MENRQHTHSPLKVALSCLCVAVLLALLAALPVLAAHPSHRHHKQHGRYAYGQRRPRFGHYLPPHGPGTGLAGKRSRAGKSFHPGQSAHVVVDIGPIETGDWVKIKASYIYEKNGTWHFGTWPGGAQTKLLSFNPTHTSETLVIPTGSDWEKLVVIYDGTESYKGALHSEVDSYEVKLTPSHVRRPRAIKVQSHYTPPHSSQ